MKKPAAYLALTFLFFLSFGMVSHAATVDVSMVNITFQPQTVTINAGDTVRWTNIDSFDHTTTSGTGCAPNGMWDSGTVGPGQSFEVTFNTPGTFPYYCTFHCASFNMVGSVVVNAAASTMALPVSPQAFSYPAIVSPVLNTTPALAKPIGAGSVATGGGTLSLHVALDPFAGPIDEYFLIFIPGIDPNNVYQLTSLGTLQPLSAGLAPFLPSTAGPISQGLFGDIPTGSLPPGQYFFAVVVTPAGDSSLTKYYLWITLFTL